MELCKQYYKLFPRNKKSGGLFTPFDSVDKVKNKLQIIVYLTNIEKAVKILLAANNNINYLNPLNYLYCSFQTIFEKININSSEYKIIEKYINASNKSDKIINIYSIKRKAELRRQNFDNLKNHYLLFHGTRISNLIGIFSEGITLPNTPFPHKGNTYVRGIYFTDNYRRSSIYSEKIENKKNKNKKFYVLLCEVALGDILCKNQGIDLDDLDFLKNGYNSLKSISEKGPNPDQNLIFDDGIIIPCGDIIDYNNNNIQFKSLVPEYIIYNEEQIKLRYIISLEKN